MILHNPLHAALSSNTQYLQITADNKDLLTSQNGTKFFDVRSSVVEGHLGEDLAVMQVNSGVDAFQLSVSGSHLIVRQNDNPTTASWPATFTKVMNDGDTAAAAIKLATKRNINKIGFDGTADISIPRIVAIDLTGKTQNLDSLTLSASGSIGVVEYYVCTTNGGSQNITNAAVSGYPFSLIVTSIRWASTSDYITQQEFVSTQTKEMYRRFCTNGTWTTWQKILDSNGKATTAGTADKVGHTLTFTGGVSDTFDGSAAKSVAIPAASSTTPKIAASTAAVGSETKFARGDHVHPVQTSVSGNAGTATKLATARSLKTNLGSTAAVTFDGSAAQDSIPITGTLAVSHGGTGSTTAAAARTALGITAANLGAVAKAGDTMTGNLTMSGATQAIKYASGTRTGSPITFYAGDVNGSGIVIGDGGRTIIGAGESASALRTALGTTAADEGKEELHLASDGPVYIHTNGNTIANRKTVTINNSGNINAPGGFTGSLSGKATSAGTADSAAKLTTARSLKTNLGSTTAVTFDGSAAQDNIPITGTLAVGHGGTGATTLTSGAALIGNGANAVTTRAITNMTAKGPITGYNTNLMTTNTLAFWNGSFDANGTSNLAYLGTVTKGTWNASTIAISHGGTGASSATGALKNLGIQTITYNVTCTTSNTRLTNTKGIKLSTLNILTFEVAHDGATAQYETVTISNTSPAVRNLYPNVQIQNMSNSVDIYYVVSSYSSSMSLQIWTASGNVLPAHYNILILA